MVNHLYLPTFIVWETYTWFPLYGGYGKPCIHHCLGRYLPTINGFPYAPWCWYILVQNCRGAGYCDSQQLDCDDHFLCPYSMVLVYLPTKQGDFVRANVGK